MICFLFYINIVLFNFRLLGGLLDDIKRKVPFYVSDFKDALHVQCLASFIFLYFACLTPVITFGGLLNDATGGNMVSKLLLSSTKKRLICIIND